MGKGMASNICAKGASIGLEKFWVYDTNSQNTSLFMDSMKEHNSSFPTLELAHSAEGLLQCDVVGLSLPSESVCEHVLFDSREGMIPRCLTQFRGERPPERKVIIDHGTYSKGFVEECQRRITKMDPSRMIAYMDAPVSGGPTGAKNGTLTIMVGSTPEIFQQCKPLLELYSAKVVHFGPVGMHTSL